MKILRALLCGILLLGSAFAQNEVRAGGTARVGGNVTVNGNGHLTLSSIAVAPSTQSQLVGQSVGFTATGTYSNGATSNLTGVVAWTTSNSAIASLSTLAAVQPALCVSAGTAQITATFGTATSTATLTCTGIVPPPPTLSSITVTPLSPQQNIGQSTGFTATGTYSDGTHQDLTAKVSWSSSNTAKATLGALSATQLVNCVGSGTSNITATLGVSGASTLTCVATLSSLTVSPASPSLIIGASIGFTATGLYTDGTSQDVTGSATWASSNTATATLGTKSAQQSVNCVTSGTSTISATVGSVTNSTVLTCAASGPHVPTLTSITVTPTNPSINIGNSQAFTATGTYSDGTTANVSSQATWTTGTPAKATLQLADGVVGVPYSQPLTAIGSAPYTWTVPSGTLPSGAIDIFDYLIPPNRATSHLTGATNKSTVLQAEILWMLKGANGNPWDGWWYDDRYIYFAFTENNDASQQAACTAAINPLTGLPYSSCFVNPYSYKLSTPGKLFAPRYFVPGSTVTLLSPPVLTAGNVNAYIRTTNCGADNQPILYLGNVKTVTSGPTNVSFGGGVGTQPTIEIDYYYSAGIDGIYHSRERFYMALGFGQVKWTFGTRQADGSYLDSQTSLNTTVVAGGAPTPNFACKVPPPPLTGMLPATVLRTAGPPTFDLNSFTGVISGTPTTAGLSSFTVQQEDAAGALHLSAQKINIVQGTATASQTVNCVTAGTSVITATISAVSGNTTVTCVNPAATLSSLAINPANPTVYVASSAGLTATGTFSDGTKQNITSLSTWTTSNSAIASIGAASNPQTVNCLAVGSATITATDGAVSNTTTITCQTPVPTTFGNDYGCAVGNVPSFGSTDAYSDLPLSCYYTNPSAIRPSGTVRIVTSNATWTSAWAATNCGDIVQITAGTVLIGPLTIPVKVCTAGNYIWLRTSGYASLPAYGVKVSPCYAGVASLPGRPNFNCTSTANVMAKITTGAGTSPPLVVTSGFSYLLITGLEITRASGTGVVSPLVNINTGGGVNHIIFDHVWVHGTETGEETNTGIGLNRVNYAAIVDSFFNDFYCVSVSGSCTDAHPIGGGVNGNAGDTDNTWKIAGNYIEGAGQGILFGGGGAAITPSDIEVIRNYFFKPMTWNPSDPSYNGGVSGHALIIKNNFELKNAQRVLFEGNVLQNNWGGFSQPGTMILYTPKNQAQGTTNICPLCKVINVTTRFNYITTSAKPFDIANAAAANSGYATAGNSYSVHDNVADNQGYSTCFGCSAGTFTGQTTTDPAAPSSFVLKKIFYDHNTFVPSGTVALKTFPGLWGISGPLASSGRQMDQFTFTNNLSLKGLLPFANPLDSCTNNPVTNCACGQSTTTQVLTSCFTTYSVGGNAIVNNGSTAWPGQNCTSVTSMAAIFVNYNNGLRGDYHLAPGSPCHNTGTDGRDPGADIDTLNNRISGVGAF